MQRLPLSGHYGTRVEVDLCAPCHLVWFDAIESARITGPGLLALVQAMADAQRLPHQMLQPAAHCPRCRGPLKKVANQTRWGRSVQLECAAHHGCCQSFAQFLAERGLVRAMSSADRALLSTAGPLHCVNCGAGLGLEAAACRWCASVPSLFDVARLARALDPEGATESHAVHRRAAQASALNCLACGATVPAGPSMACSQCGATLATSRLVEACRQVSVLAPALQAHAVRPAGHVVRRRLAAQSTDLPRRREWAAEMQAEADAQAGRTRFDPPTQEGPDLSPKWLLLAVLLGLLWWWLA